jgi:hypothetical protein
MEVLVFAVFAVMAVFAASFAFAAIRRVGRWNRTYERLGKRYAGKPGRAGGVAYGFGLTKPSLTFDYGRTICSIRNRKSYRFSSGYHTEISMIWPNRKLRLEVSTSPHKPRNWGPGATQQVIIDEPQFQSDYYVSGNDPHLIQRLLTSGVQWQIHQLRRHMRNDEVQITISRGNLVVYKPGYIKDYISLEDFVRYSLELFDQLMLVNAEGIDFVNANQASVVDNVKCPICSELILQNLVVCSRCKTPHCQDCWQYNGQCATFACSETRCLYMGNVS